VHRLPSDQEAYIVVSLGVHTSSGNLVIDVAQSLDPLATSLRAVTEVMYEGLPVLTVLIAGIAWAVVGRALRPVEAIRQRVAAIGGRAGAERVPEPGTDDEIGRLATTMNAMLARLHHSARQQQRFVSDASHELRSPIASIRTQLDVAQAYPDESRTPELVVALLAEAHRLETLVSDLLLLARLDEGGGPWAAAEMDLDDLIHREAARLRAQGRVRVDTSRVHAARLIGDERSVQRALTNLADNAERHARSTVWFGCRPSGAGTVEVTVSDDGPGVPMASRVRIFERFTRLDDARDRSGGGTGLGLAIVAEVARRHGGHVRVDDAVGGGARFELLLSNATMPVGATTTAAAQ
jgi:signal transduction histidine kinase